MTIQSLESVIDKIFLDYKLAWTNVPVINNKRNPRDIKACEEAAKAALLKTVDKYVEEEVRRGEQYVAEHFAGGVPYGFTVGGWLAVARATFDEEGKPTTHPTTLRQQVKEAE
jgi:hypothetical protein